jgi:hypothetical protein
MPRATNDPPRPIVEEFRKQILEKKRSGPKPAADVIAFREEKRAGTERPVEFVPLDLLRYRADNGRIASDVLNYAKENSPLDEKTKEAQKVLEKFLFSKDPEKTEILMKSVEHTGQSAPAIITCDGFLINGNRRRMVLEKLRLKHPGKTEFETMKVVILPGPGDEGGPPSLLEIEKLENRYQLQSEGKSEYYGFDRALSVKRKMELGFSLEEQVRDDPRYANALEKDITKAVREIENELLAPLECVDRYLEMFGREGLYGNVSSGFADKEGRWQAFIDYSHTYQRYFRNQQWMLMNGLEDDDVGPLENAAFKMIRLRHLKDLGKIHQVMRQLPKLCGLKDARKELIKISEKVPDNLPAKEHFDEKGQPLSPEQNDRKWVLASQEEILHHLKKAVQFRESDQDKATPISLLETALRKLNHEEMQVNSMAVADFPKARQLAADIGRRAKELEGEIYHAQKDHTGLQTKKK